jgi:hypothetical protein
MLSVARPYSLHAVTGTSTGLCLTERWYLPWASQEFPPTEVDTPPLFSTRPTAWTDGHRQRTDQLIRLPPRCSTRGGAALLKKSTMGHAGRSWGTDRNTKGLMMMALLLRS